jgi:threonine/homoserine/homoserine lactone efflux protein
MWKKVGGVLGIIAGVAIIGFVVFMFATGQMPEERQFRSIRSLLVGAFLIWGGVKWYRESES